MATFLIAGIPAIVICLLTGIVILERHANGVGARKRAEQLKLWLSSQSSASIRVRGSVAGNLR
jgi:hypothetical protein